MPVRALIFRTELRDQYRVGRTARSLQAGGFTAEELGGLAGDSDSHCRSRRKEAQTTSFGTAGPDDNQSLLTSAPTAVPEPRLAELLRTGEPLLCLRAGAWLCRTEGFELPMPSTTGKGLCALGAVRSRREDGVAAGGPMRSESDQATAWQDLLSQVGGDFAGLAGSPHFPPAILNPPASFFLDAALVKTLAEEGVHSFEGILRTALLRGRLVHYASLDVYDDPGWRGLQVVTALQRGGAERVTLDLVGELPAHGVRVRLLTLGRSLREAFPTPPGTVELAKIAPNLGKRGAALLRIATAFGADVVHGHLITADDARFLSAGGFPVVLTVHNTRAGWPEGMAELRARDASLLVGCAQAVETELSEAGIPVPLRTVWNGLDLREFQSTPERLAQGIQWRRSWGFADGDFVLIALANPRPQKRLHLLPRVLAALRATLSSPMEARLVLAGETVSNSPEAARCVEETRAEAARLGLEAHVRWTGSVAEVAGLLTAGDALVSTSAHEGLSLAQLEALALGRPVVATDVGGAREIAADQPDFHLLPAQASPEQFADVLARIALGPRPGRGRVVSLENWSRQRMAARYRWLYPRAIAASRRSGGGNGIWLVTNNFSTGGAQSSARRLLLGLAAEGVSVRAVVVEENPDRPTPGRRALLEASLKVLAMPPEGSGAAAVEALLAEMDADPPQSVVFWNLRPAWKMWLADALLDIPVFDISPGEMFFQSIESHFAKSHPGWPYRTARDYGARLAGVIVKYQAEARRAAEVLGAPVYVVPNGVPLPTKAGVIRSVGALLPREAGKGKEAEECFAHGEHEPACPLPVNDPSFSPPSLPARQGESAGERGEGFVESPRSRLVFGTAARINPQKRLEDLLEAFRAAYDRLPHCVLRIAGGVEHGCADYASRLRTLSEGLPVEWVGEVTDMPTFHRGLDVFVMISEPAGCPNASLEAMAAGLPVIATDVGGACEQVIEGVTGRLVAPRAPEMLAAALLELASQPLLRSNMGAAARNQIVTHFSQARMISDYRRIWLNGNPSRPDHSEYVHQAGRPC